MATPTEIADYSDIIAFKPSIADIPRIQELVESIYREQIELYMDPAITGASTRLMSTYLYLHLIQLTWPSFFSEGTQDNSRWEAPAGPITRIKARNQEIQYQNIDTSEWTENFFLQTTWGEVYLSLLRNLRQRVGVKGGFFFGI